MHRPGRQGPPGHGGQGLWPTPCPPAGSTGTAMCRLWAGPASRALPTQHCRWVQAPTAPVALGSAESLGSGRPFTACMGLLGPTTRRAQLASVGAALPEAARPPVLQPPVQTPGSGCQAWGDGSPGQLGGTGTTMRATVSWARGQG